MAVLKKWKRVLCLFYVGLLFTSALLIFGCSVYFGYKLVSFTSYFKFATSECIGPVILIFLLGCTHIGITWLGANGTISDNAKYIIWFLIILVTLIITEFAVGVWSMVLCGKIPETSAVLINSTFHDFVKYGYYKSDWESLQSEMECCAVNNMSDYIGIGSMPLSCCKSSDCSVEIFRIGCKDPVIAYVKKLLYNIGFISFGSALFLFLGAVAFYYYHKAIKAEKNKSAVVSTKRQEENPLNRQRSKP